MFSSRRRREASLIAILLGACSGSGQLQPGANAATGEAATKPSDRPAPARTATENASAREATEASDVPATRAPLEQLVGLESTDEVPEIILAEAPELRATLPGDIEYLSITERSCRRGRLGPSNKSCRIYHVAADGGALADEQMLATMGHNIERHTLPTQDVAKAIYERKGYDVPRGTALYFATDQMDARALVEPWVTRSQDWAAKVKLAERIGRAWILGRVVWEQGWIFLTAIIDTTEQTAEQIASSAEVAGMFDSGDCRVESYEAGNVLTCPRNLPVGDTNPGLHYAEIRNQLHIRTVIDATGNDGRQ